MHLFFWIPRGEWEPHLPRSAGRSVDSGLRIVLWWALSALYDTPVGNMYERTPTLPSPLRCLPAAAALQGRVIRTPLSESGF